MGCQIGGTNTVSVRACVRACVCDGSKESTRSLKETTVIPYSRGGDTFYSAGWSYRRLEV